MPETILLTGGTGFLGRNLLARLLEQGYRVVLLKRGKSRLERIAPWRDRVVIRETPAGDLAPIFREERIDAILHCATNYGRDGVPPADIVEANLILPLRLLHAAADGGLRAFVNSDTILDKRISHYSLSKRHFSEWLASYSAGLVCVDVALEHFYGPGDDPSKFVTKIVHDFLDRVPRIALTAGAQRRDFIYVDDVVDAFSCVLRFALDAPRGRHRFEVGSNEPVSIRDFVELAWRLAGRPPTVRDFGALPYRENEIMDSVVDTAPLRRLGWGPTVPLEEGLRRTIEGERGARSS